MVRVRLPTWPSCLAANSGCRLSSFIAYCKLDWRQREEGGTTLWMSLAFNEACDIISLAQGSHLRKTRNRHVHQRLHNMNPSGL